MLLVMGAVDPVEQYDLCQLLSNMREDFISKWGEECHYRGATARGERNRQVGIPTYAYWVLLLDPRTKKGIPKILKKHGDKARLWIDLN